MVPHIPSILGRLDKLESHVEPILERVLNNRQHRASSIERCLSEGLAVTQRHHEDDEKSHWYDELVAAEAVAKTAKKRIHLDKELKKGTINDLADPRKAKSYSIVAL